jgi:hypothetical protein
MVWAGYGQKFEDFSNFLRLDFSVTIFLNAAVDDDGLREEEAACMDENRRSI